MKLSKHKKLLKGPNQHGIQPRGVKSKLKEERRIKKLELKSGMVVEVENKSAEQNLNSSKPLSVGEKMEAKALRKLANHHNLHYKKMGPKSITGKDGPRAITK